ncbi:MAG: DNA-directed RNA polymerase subunit alpha [Bacteroidia bacterium]
MGVIPFQKPNKVVMTKSNDAHGVFEFFPLEKGYGVTIGNAMRRVLLSSLEGYAISGVKIQGVEHEFSTIKGVVEDVVEIVLNLKQVRFKSNTSTEEQEKLFISIKGKDQFLAGDIGRYTNDYVILNPDHVICNMDPTVNLEMELIITKGRGYVPAEENKQKDASIGMIPTDSIYTPIKNVRFDIEDYRVEQKTDFEKLVMEVSSDGSIHPEEALKEAAKILIGHFVLFSDENIMPETKVSKVVEEVDETFLQMRKILKTPLADLDLSVRAYNCLKAAEIKTLGELVNYHIEDLLKFRNFGKKSLSELEEFVRDRGLHFGMDVAKYNLNDD